MFCSSQRLENDETTEGNRRVGTNPRRSTESRGNRRRIRNDFAGCNLSQSSSLAACQHASAAVPGHATGVDVLKASKHHHNPLRRAVGKHLPRLHRYLQLLSSLPSPAGNTRHQGCGWFLLHEVDRDPHLCRKSVRVPGTATGTYSRELTIAQASKGGIQFPHCDLEKRRICKDVPAHLIALVGPQAM